MLEWVEMMVGRKKTKELEDRGKALKGATVFSKKAEQGWSRLIIGLSNTVMWI